MFSAKGGDLVARAGTRIGRVVFPRTYAGLRSVVAEATGRACCDESSLVHSQVRVQVPDAKPGAPSGSRVDVRQTGVSVPPNAGEAPALHVTTLLGRG
jgi:hypothetical protein